MVKLREMWEQVRNISDQLWGGAHCVERIGADAGSLSGLWNPENLQKTGWQGQVFIFFFRFSGSENLKTCFFFSFRFSGFQVSKPKKKLENLKTCRARTGFHVFFMFWRPET